jgi:hypothetical protein
VHGVLLATDAMHPEAVAEGIDVAVSDQEITITLPGDDTEVVRLGNS